MVYSRHEDLFIEDARNIDDANYDRYLSLILPSRPSDFSFQQTIEKLAAIFGPQKTLFHRRYECLTLQKSETQDIDSYAADVNRQCEGFNLAALTSDQFKCLIFVCGLQSPSDFDIRTRLLTKIQQDNAATIQTLITDCQTMANLKNDAEMVEKRNDQLVQRIQRPKFRNQQNHTSDNTNQDRSENQSKSPTNQSKLPANQSKSPANQSKSPTGNENRPPRPCWGCGAMHFSKDCPYRQHRCNDCNKIGHKEGYCRLYRGKAVKSVEIENIVSIVNVVKTANSKRKHIALTINGAAVRLQLDSGSDITIISKMIWSRIGQPTIFPTKHVAKNASKDVLRLMGEIECEMDVCGIKKSGKCYVGAVDVLNVFGIDWIEQFNLWDVPFSSVCNKIRSECAVEHLKSQYADVFTDRLGLCIKTKVTLYKKPDAKPVFRPKRPVSFAALPIIDQELQRLESLNIISPVDFSECAAPIVVVHKANGLVRICADYSTGLNAALETNNFPLPLPDEIFAKMANGKIFSHIDLSDAYLQVPVDEESSKLLTINTHRGLFRFNRLAPGVKSAPGDFQRIMSAMVDDLPGSAAYMDDIIISGQNEAEHEKNLHSVLKRIREYGFNLRFNKCKCYMSSLKYLGFVIDGEGLHPERIVSVVKMPAPTDVTTLRSYLGAVNCYGKFIKDMHNIRYPLNKLLQQGVKFEWSPDCQRSFDKFKDILQSDLMLTHYNPDLEIIVAADASNMGIGACIMHRFPNKSIKVIAHASRTLSKAESNYGQIDKEGLALIFAVRKFHRMIFGRHFTLQTDHKPLLSIFGSKTGIPVYTANRLQRWCTMLLNYDFKIKYINTNDFGYADVLSRLNAVCYRKLFNMSKPNGPMTNQVHWFKGSSLERIRCVLFRIVSCLVINW